MSKSPRMTELMHHLPGRVTVAEADALYDELAFALAAAAQEAVEARGVFHAALSGGSTPEPFYMRLVLDPRFRGIPWDKTHVWIVDERRVPDDDDESNVKMIRQTLTEHVPMNRRQLHPMPVMESDPAGVYASELREVFACTFAAPPRLDFVLLGMGDDAHTASLFPRSEALKETQRWIAVNDGPAVTPPPRVTMTFPLLNAARRLAVLVVGERKRATVKRIDAQFRAGASDIERLPITGVSPTDGEVGWFLDTHAAGGAVD